VTRNRRFTEGRETTPERSANGGARGWHDAFAFHLSPRERTAEGRVRGPVLKSQRRDILEGALLGVFQSWLPDRMSMAALARQIISCSLGFESQQPRSGGR